MYESIPVSGGHTPVFGIGGCHSPRDVAHFEWDVSTVSLQWQGRWTWGHVVVRAAEPGRFRRRSLPSDLGHWRALFHIRSGFSHVLHWQQKKKKSINKTQLLYHTLYDNVLEWLLSKTQLCLIGEHSLFSASDMEIFMYWLHLFNAMFRSEVGSEIFSKSLKRSKLPKVIKYIRTKRVKWFGRFCGMSRVTNSQLLSSCSILLTTRLSLIWKFQSCVDRLYKELKICDRSSHARYSITQLSFGAKEKMIFLML